MGPSDRCRASTSCPLPHHHHHYHHHLHLYPHHHHHHHHHHLIFCPLHHHHHHHHHYLNFNSRVNFNFAHHPPQYLQPAGAVPLQNEADITLSQDDAPMLQEQDHEGLEDVGEKDDDEPIFVLTDEWREFFAVSEAKRKLEKKKAKKKKRK